MAVQRKGGLARILDHQDALADVIFVPGLDGGIATHNGALSDLEWIAEELPRRLSKARTFVFKRSQGIQTTLVETVETAAEELLAAFETLIPSSAEATSSGLPCNGSLQWVTPSRPVLFICYGLGGLVVKQALLLGESQNRAHPLLHQTFGMVFLGTPHAEDIGLWVQEVTTTLAFTRQDNTKTRGNHSSVVNEKLTGINNAFQRMAPLYFVIKFCDGTLPLCSSANMVTQDCLWRMLAQFQVLQSEDMHYVVPASLPREICLTCVKNSIDSMNDAAARYQKSHLASLQREREIRDLHARTRLSDTCDWLFGLEAYRYWILAESPPLLWLHGSPGSGKSVLCSAILDDLESSKAHDFVVLFGFIEEDFGLLDTARQVLKAIIYQLSGYCCPTIPYLLLRSTLNGLERQSVPTSPKLFRNTLKVLLTNLDCHTKVFLILDGLDNEEWIRVTLVDEIIQANASRPRENAFRCAIATQAPYDAALYQGCATGLNLDIEPGVQNDLLKFAEARLEHLSLASDATALSTAHLAKELSSRARGNFLWLALVIEDICRLEATTKLVDHTAALPVTVEGIYHRIFQALSPRNFDLIQKVFSWLAAVNRPFYLPELCEALTINLELAQPSTHTLLQSQEVPRRYSYEEICRLCGWLVCVTSEGMVRFRHPTVWRYWILNSRFKTSRQLLLEAHELVAQTCLRVLESAEGNNVSWLCSSTPLFQGLCGTLPSDLTSYAVANWSVHYRFAERFSKVLAGTLQRRLFVTLEYACASYPTYQNGRRVQIESTVLKISARFGFPSLTKLCLESGIRHSTDDCNHCETPLTVAAANGNTEVAALLLQYLSAGLREFAFDIESALYRAAAHGSLSTLQLLMKHGAKVHTSELHPSRTLLHVAAAKGHLSIIKALMELDMDVNAAIPTTLETPLHLAAANGHLESVEYLVDGRDNSKKEVEMYDRIAQQPCYLAWAADPPARSQEREPLSWKADTQNFGLEEMRDLLAYSSRYADVNKTNSQGWTPLYLAAREGHEGVVRFLHERGASLQPEGTGKRTPLQAAAENGHLATVRFLIEAGADVDAGTENLGGILENVRRNGYYTTANLLLWRCFSARIIGTNMPRPMLSLAIKSDYNVIQETSHGRKGRKRSSTRPIHRHATHKKLGTPQTGVESKSRK